MGDGGGGGEMGDGGGAGRERGDGGLGRHRGLAPDVAHQGSLLQERGMQERLPGFGASAGGRIDTFPQDGFSQGLLSSGGGGGGHEAGYGASSGSVPHSHRGLASAGMSLSGVSSHGIGGLLGLGGGGDVSHGPPFQAGGSAGGNLLNPLQQLLSSAPSAGTGSEGVGNRGGGAGPFGNGSSGQGVWGFSR